MLDAASPLPGGPHPPNDNREELRSASEASCALALAKMGPLPLAAPEWRSLQAPGCLAPPASDARRSWAAMDCWTRLEIPSEYGASLDFEGDGFYTCTLEGHERYPLPSGPGEIVVARGVCLPDQWPVDRRYHHAWYALRTELYPRAGERLWLRFDAVAHACAVFVNGREAGRHLGGFTPFELDIAPLARDGENTVVLWMQDDTAVRDIANRRAIAQLGCGKGTIHGRFAGIRGGVYFEARPAAHVARVRVRPSTRKMELNVESWVRGAPEGAVVKQAVYEWPNGGAPALELPDATVPAANAPEPARVETRVPWTNPKLWSPARPSLYVLRTTVVAGGASETVETRFGFREFWIDGAQFMLNGKPIRLFGDAGQRREMRSIVPEAAREHNRRAFEFLKREFNYMSTRLHTLLFPVWALQAADEAGVLVIHQSGLKSGDRAFYQNGGEELLRNLEAEYGEWYWRDANSPSVVVWDMENEIIRGQLSPEMLRWALRLDSFIKQHDPDAITEHSGAAWYHPDQQIIHVHMQEHYSRIMRDWRAQGGAPLIMGECWIGGNGETRLPNSYEYADREDWHREEARLYREHMIEMRYHGVSGIMPHRLTHWPLLKAGPVMSRQELAKLGESPYRWRFETVRAEGARGMAPVVGFVWPRSASVLEGEAFAREVVVCNDREEACELEVHCRYGGQSLAWRVALGPAEQRRMEARFDAEAGADAIRVEVLDENGAVVERDQAEVHAIAREAAEFSGLSRRVVVVPEIDAETAEALDELGVPWEASAALPEDAEAAIALVPAGAPPDALGRDAAAVRRFLDRGGRLLVLPQSEPPRWMPLGLPFWPSARTSVPTYTGAGWAPTNKDLNFTSAAPVYAPGHPAFAGLDERDFKDWDPFDGKVSDDAFIRPNAVGMSAGGACRVLLGATRRENISLAECRSERGAAVFCQAHALRLRANPAARTLFLNLLRYLDGPAWTGDVGLVGLVGDLAPERLAALTGLAAERFVPATAADQAPGLILAGDGADTDTLTGLAESGRTVLVLSAETCGRLPGFRVEQDEDAFYSATRRGAEDHPIFWGVAGASFLPLEQTPVRGALAEIPEDARVLLGGHGRGHSPFRNDWSADIGFYGLETREAAPPLAAGWKVGRGEIVATAIEPWDDRSETHRQLLVGLLANAGVAVPLAAGQAGGVEVRHTVPLRFDGLLDDWTNDTDDINISTHSHAQPIVLSSRDAVEGQAENDLDLSGIVYLLHDRERLYVGGILFSSGPDPALDMDLDGAPVRIAPAEKAVEVDRCRVEPPGLAVGRQPASEVIDARLLNLSRINKQGQRAEAQPDAPGTTFEVALPWEWLGFDQPPERLRGRFRLSRQDGCALRQPPPSGDGSDWLALLPQAPATPTEMALGG